MKALSIKEVIRFRNKKDSNRIVFAKTLMRNTEVKDLDSGGDYWVSCVSAICNSYRFNDPQYIDDKISLLEKKIDNKGFQRTQNMYKINLTILHSYINRDWSSLRPNGIKFLKKK
jgi:hypothetical protein